MGEINKADLDNYITGHWGENQYRDDSDESTCSECGWEFAHCTCICPACGINQCHGRTYCGGEHCDLMNPEGV